MWPCSILRSEFYGAAFLNIGRTGVVTGRVRPPEGRDSMGVVARHDLAYVRAEQLFGSGNAADSSLTPPTHTASDACRGRGIRGFRGSYPRALGLLRQHGFLRDHRGGNRGLPLSRAAFLIEPQYSAPRRPACS